MNKHVNAVAGRLSLRPPQRRSLEILDRVTEVVRLSKTMDREATLEIIRNEFPSVTDFERDFPSLCFALATGVGKTRLMGAFISYLHLARGLNNFLVLAPNLTIYRKLIADFTPNTTKYVFKGIAEFAINAPEVITGDDYNQRATTLFDQLVRCRINIFNISKITSEVRGGRSPKIKRLSEYIGKSYFNYLSALPDLVLLMDESHRYRASAGAKAINELKPVLGLELTATPKVETSRGSTLFKNIIFDYPLGAAMADGFVKEPAVVTRKDFNPAEMTQEAIEQMKLEDGVRLHEAVKVDLETYARETGKPLVKPFVLVIARDITHAKQLLDLIESDAFFNGSYRGKAIQVDSSRTGTEEEAMIERLLKVEHTDDPTEIVIHVNMLKEGWDVTNLYTIVPLRAANAQVLIEQSIGRGLRLPYGVRTGVAAVDRLNIVSHDRFKEIVDEANRPGSAIRVTSVVLDPQQLAEKKATVVAPSRLDVDLGLAAPPTLDGTPIVPPTAVFATDEERKVAAIASAVIDRLATKPTTLPTVSYLSKPEIRDEIAKAVSDEYAPVQTELDVGIQRPNISAVVAKTAELVEQRTIDIPRIVVIPRGHVTSRFEPFTLDLSGLRYAPVSEDLWIQHLRTGQVDVLAIGRGGVEERRLEDYVVSGLISYDDVSYDDHADLLYDLAGQVVQHLSAYLPEADTRKVLRYHQREIARFVHVQMQPHFCEDASEGYEVVVNRGVTPIKPVAYAATVSEGAIQYTVSPTDKSNYSKYLFCGFQRCLYDVQKFQSDQERRMAVILERESKKWMKPVKGQFQIFYRSGVGQAEYQPDFVVETDDEILMIEVKARNELSNPEVLSKKATAVEWCRNASDFAVTHGGKPWRYCLIPHDEVLDNVSLAWLKDRSA